MDRLTSTAFLRIAAALQIKRSNCVFVLWVMNKK